MVGGAEKAATKDSEKSASLGDREQLYFSSRAKWRFSKPVGVVALVYP
jgi:hypothetical protein